MRGESARCGDLKICAVACSEKIEVNFLKGFSCPTEVVYAKVRRRKLSHLVTNQVNGTSTAS